MRSENPFSPDFGRPLVFSGRRRYVAVAQEAMGQGVRPNRALLIEGLRGTGKTALLCHIRDLAHARGWEAIYVTSVDAANDICHDIAMLEDGERSISGAGMTIAGFGASVTLAKPSEPSGPPSVRNALIDHMRRTKAKGLMILIDEMQKISEADAQAICDAVITARALNDDVALVMAGLPGTLSRIERFPKCTYMARSTFMRLGLLSQAETEEALRSMFALVPEIGIDETVLLDVAAFTKGHPYLMQLVGYNLYRAAESQVSQRDRGRGDAVVKLTPEMVAAAEETAYESYAAKVLDMVFGDLGTGTMDYIRAIAATMDEAGVMESGRAIAESLGKDPDVVNTYRTRVKAMGITRASGHGRLVFTIPYIPRYLAEGTAFEEDELYGDDPGYPMT